MKLLITIVHERDYSKVSESLLAAGYKFTKISTTGGLLRDGNATLFIGVDEKDVDTVLGLVRDSCKTREQYVNLPPPEVMPAGTFIPNPVKVSVGGAIVFVVDVERFERL
ncbi:MAG: cyclic-di-AMP receptor [Armatimonadetes bacterium]|nr:cyclic-di-AMP receptor [Armatimonadota bacterium]